MGLDLYYKWFPTYEDAKIFQDGHDRTDDMDSGDGIFLTFLKGRILEKYKDEFIFNRADFILEVTRLWEVIHDGSEDENEILNTIAILTCLFALHSLDDEDVVFFIIG